MTANFWRVCRTCSRLLAEDQFRYRPDEGRFLRVCRTCERARNRGYDQKRKDAHNARRCQYYAENKEAIQQRDRAYRARCAKAIRARKKAYYIKNRERLLAQTNRHKQDNREAKRQADKLYREANRPSGRLRRRSRRAREQAAHCDATAIMRDWEVVVRLHGCFYCGGAMEHLEHMVPLSRGGDHTEENTVGACAHCNLSKGAKIFPDEWLPPSWTVEEAPPGLL